MLFRTRPAIIIHKNDIEDEVYSLIQETYMSFGEPFIKHIWKENVALDAYLTSKGVKVTQEVIFEII